MRHTDSTGYKPWYKSAPTPRDNREARAQSTRNFSNRDQDRRGPQSPLEERPMELQRRLGIQRRDNRGVDRTHRQRPGPCVAGCGARPRAVRLSLGPGRSGARSRGIDCGDRTGTTGDEAGDGRAGRSYPDRLTEQHLRPTSQVSEFPQFPQFPSSPVSEFRNGVACCRTALAFAVLDTPPLLNSDG